MDVLIVHYNTQELTEAAIRSLWKHTPGAKVTVFDNSNRGAFSLDGLNGNNGNDGKNGRIEVIDNTRGQCIDLDAWIEGFPDRDLTVEAANRYASARHCKSVDYCMEMFPDGFLLMDSDVLVRKDVTPLADRRYAWVGQVSMFRSRYRVTLQRVLPMLCWVNTPMCLNHGAGYCNQRKMYGLSKGLPNVSYDTGCWFHEAVQAAQLPVRQVKIGDYIHHFGHGSWKEKDPQEWLQTHRGLWE